MSWTKKENTFALPVLFRNRAFGGRLQPESRKLSWKSLSKTPRGEEGRGSAGRSLANARDHAKLYPPPPPPTKRGRGENAPLTQPMALLPCGPRNNPLLSTLAHTTTATHRKQGNGGCTAIITPPPSLCPKKLLHVAFATSPESGTNHLRFFPFCVARVFSPLT